MKIESNPNNKKEEIPKITESIDESGRIESLKNQEDITSKEYIFRNIIENKVLDSFTTQMEESGFTQEQISEFEGWLVEDEHKISNVLAYPHELKKRMIPYFQKEIEKGVYDLRFMYDKIVARADSTQSKVAYHASKFEILPKEKRDGMGQMIEEWVINGTEKDHRDNDLPMAYYSFDYRNLYRTKNPNYLYLVESNPQHRTDGEEWGRAPSLSIIDRVDLREVDRQVEEQYQTYKKEAK